MPPAADRRPDSSFGNIVLPTHPDSIAKFRELSSPTEETKRIHADLPVACAHCNKLQGKKLVCAKCKIAAYCTRECQKLDWSSHKPVCRATMATAKLKLVNMLGSNSYIMQLVMMAFIRKFNLHKKMILDRPLIVRCDLAVDPVELPLILRIMSGELWPFQFPKGVQGMVQIKGMDKLDSDSAVDTRRMKIWEEARARPARPAPGWGPHNATGLIDFHMEGTDQVVIMPINIHDAAIRCARLEIFGSMENATGEEFVDIPTTPYYCLCAINVHIRDDINNQTRLRSHMSKDELCKYWKKSDLHRHHLEMLPMTFTEIAWSNRPPYVHSLSRPWHIIPNLKRRSKAKEDTLEDRNRRQKIADGQYGQLESQSLQY